MPKELNLDLLRTFITIAETGSFTRTAERLYSTQSTISMQVKRLEEQVNKRLLEREGRHIKLTGAGAVLLSYSKRLLEISDEARHYFDSAQTTGEARIGVPESFAVQKLPPILGKFKQAYPDVHLVVKHGAKSELRAAVTKGELDVALAFKEPGYRKDLPVWRVPLAWAIGKKHYPFPVIEPIPLALLPAPCAYRTLALPVLKQAGYSWRTTFTSQSLMSTKAAAKEGLGVAILPKPTLGNDLQALGPVDGFPELPVAEFAIYTHPSGVPEAAQKLIEFIIDSMRAD